MACPALRRLSPFLTVSDLGVCQVVALVVVQREAEAALILPQVVAHEVGVLCQVDGLQREAPQALPPVNGLQGK